MTFVSTHQVPVPGLSTWPSADADEPGEHRLDAGLDVQVISIDGKRARIVCNNGWETWVNREKLVALAPAAASPYPGVAVGPPPQQPPPLQPPPHEPPPPLPSPPPGPPSLVAAPGAAAPTPAPATHPKRPRPLLIVAAVVVVAVGVGIVVAVSSGGGGGESSPRATSPVPAAPLTAPAAIGTYQRTPTGNEESQFSFSAHYVDSAAGLVLGLTAQRFPDQNNVDIGLRSSKAVVARSPGASVSTQTFEGVAYTCATGAVPSGSSDTQTECTWAQGHTVFLILGPPVGDSAMAALAALATAGTGGV